MTPLEINKLKDKLRVGRDKKQTFILVILIFVCILIAYFYIFLRPAVGKLTELLPEVFKLSMQLKRTNSDIANRSAIENEKAALKARINEYEKGMPTQKGIPKFLEDLSETAAQAGVKIIGIMPVKTSGKEVLREEVYQELPVKINARCGYHQLGRFIYELETADRLMKISDIYIEADPSDIARHNVRLLITTYTLTTEK